MSLKWTALLPAILAAGYFSLILYFRSRGGYRQIHINEMAQAEIIPASEALSVNPDRITLEFLGKPVEK